MATYQDLFLDLRSKLSKANIEAVELNARELIAFAAGKTTEEFVRDRQLFAPAETVKRANDLCDRRVRGEPLAYILGEWDFYGLTLRITPDVLIPRMDTEVLSDWVINILRAGTDGKFRFLDLCTGSGCIGLSIANAFPNCRGVLLDVSEKAVELAGENAKNLGLNDRLIAVSGDVCKAPDMNFLGSFDVIVSNPPYITRDEMAELDRSVRDFEPQGALFGGNDGLHFYRAIVNDWLKLLKPGGFIAFECGYRQATDVGRLLKNAGCTGIKIVEDTAGIPRVVSAFAPEDIKTNDISEGNQDEC